MATVKDVAKLAGVGSGTVSRYISGTGSVSRKSAEKIARAIEQLNYRPNSMARSLSSRRSDLIGVWVPSLEGPYYHMMIRTIESALRLHGKHMILANAEDAQSNEDRLAHLDYLINRDCDGILISSSLQSEFELAKYAEKFPNVVVINHHTEELVGRSFSIDHDLGGRLAARHLVELGHTRVATITGRLSAQDARERHHAFLDEMVKLGHPVAPERIIEGAFSYAGGEQAVAALLASGADYSAVFCGNDKVAMVLIAELHKRGVSVPGCCGVWIRRWGWSPSRSAPRVRRRVSRCACPFRIPSACAVTSRRRWTGCCRPCVIGCGRRGRARVACGWRGCGRMAPWRGLRSGWHRPAMIPPASARCWR